MASATIKQPPTITLTLTLEEAKAILFVINEYFEEIEYDQEKMTDELMEVSGALESLPLRLSKYS
tara:strand:- start:6366 stop:6560 length:195 start_codon:yes stop_codon:yes gene_type:complete